MVQKCYESITHFMPLVSLYVPSPSMKHKPRFLIFSGGVERNLWHKIASDTHGILCSIANAATEEWFGPILISFVVDVIRSAGTTTGRLV